MRDHKHAQSWEVVNESTTLSGDASRILIKHQIFTLACKNRGTHELTLTLEPSREMLRIRVLTGRKYLTNRLIW